MPAPAPPPTGVITESLEPRVLMSRTDFVRAGDVDRSFGGGLVSVNFQETPVVAPVIAVQPDGKVVVAGSTGQRAGGGERLAVARYHPDGSPDLSFGPDGAGRVSTDVMPHQETAQALAFTPDGSILVAGTSSEFGTISTSGELLLVRYTPDGLLDSTFGSGGIVITDVGEDDRVTTLLVQPDGKPVIVGYDAFLGFNQRIVVARYQTDGALDPTFEVDGKLLWDLPSPNEQTIAAALDPAGGIVAAIWTFDRTGDGRGLVRFGGSGTPDLTFKPPAAVSDLPVRDVAVDADGTILLAGGSHVVALNGDGSLDRGFGRGGRATVGFGIAALEIAPDGRIVASSPAQPAPQDAAPATVTVGRFEADGRPDRAFGRRGKAIVPLGEPSAQVEDFAVAPDSDMYVLLRTPPAERPPLLLRLEGRTVPRFAALARGTLRVAGTPGGDAIEVARVPAAGAAPEQMEVRFNGFAQRFAFSDVHRIVVSGGGGDDVIAVSPDLAVPATLLGGAGHDRVTGGGGRDRLGGGAGNDALFARGGGADVLAGGPGDDRGEGDGDDVLRGVEVLPL